MVSINGQPSLFLRDLEGKEYPAVAEVNRKKRVNGQRELSLSFLYDQINQDFLHDVDFGWQILFKGEWYTITTPSYALDGERFSVGVDAVLSFFVDMNGHYLQDEVEDKSHTPAAFFQELFEDTGYSYVLVDNLTANTLSYQANQSKTERFLYGIDRFDAEYVIRGKVAYIYGLIGSDKDVILHEDLNIQDVSLEVDASGFHTWAKGFGDKDENEEDSDYKLEVEEHIPALVAKHGWIEGPAIRDGSYKHENNLKSAVKKQIESSVKISTSVTAVDLTNNGYPEMQFEEGDRVWLYVTDLKQNQQVRVVEIDETFDWEGNIISSQYTLGNEGISARYKTQQYDTLKDFKDIASGRKRLEYNWLPEAIQRASDIINGNLDSHFKYGAGEIIGINKSNPNGYMRFNTDGIGFSRDGGKTYRTAITYEGIVADYIASGTLDANLVRVLGGNETTYTFIDGDYIESRGQYYRTWFGETTFADLKFQLGRGYFRVNNEAENKRLYFSDKGISTFIQGYADENPDQENSGSGVIEFFSHQYNGPQWNTGNIRGLTLFSNQGHVAIKTANRDIILDADRDVKILASRGTVTLQPRDGNRDGLNHFRFNVKDNDSAGLSDGWIQYGSPAANYGSGLRFKKSTSGRPIIYATNGNGDINSGNFQADSFIGSLEAQSDNAYALVNDRLRITSKAGYNGGNINYRDLQAAEGMFRSLKLNTDMSGSNFYIGVSGGELRVTSNLLGAGGNYRPIRVGEVILDGGGRLVHEDGSTFIQGNVDVRATRVRSGTLVPMVAREFNSSSSEELKANIKPYEGNGLDVVCGLNIVNFDWIESPEAGRQIGVIAENSPDISSSSGKEIKINDLVMYLTKSVQELHEENNKLRGEIEHGKQSHKFNRQFFGRSSSRQSPTNRRIRNSCSRAAS